MIQLRTCSTCKKDKPLSEFWSHRLQDHCKTCRSCRDARLKYNQRKRAGNQPGQQDPRGNGQRASEHDLLGLPPGTLAVAPARSRPGDRPGDKWYVLR